MRVREVKREKVTAGRKRLHKSIQDGQLNSAGAFLGEYSRLLHENPSGTHLIREISDDGKSYQTFKKSDSFFLFNSNNAVALLLQRGSKRRKGFIYGLFYGGNYSHSMVAMGLGERS